MSTTQMGTVFASFELTQFLTNFLSPRLILYLGVRRALCCGTAVTAIGALAFAYVVYAPPGIPFFFASLTCRIVAGIGSSITDIAMMTLILSHFEDRVSLLMVSVSPVT